MRRFIVIDQLDTTEEGPEAIIFNSNNEAEFQQVFLNQGSLDGACGPYSIFMGLLSLGVLNRKDITSFDFDGRTKIGKLFKDLNTNHFSLFKNGTFLNDLQDILLKHFRNHVNIEACFDKGKKVINFTLDNIKNNNPTVVGVIFPSGAHWMLAVGYEEIDGKAERLLLLDPSGTSPEFCSWNAIIDLSRSHSKKYPYCWWGTEHDVQFEEALSLQLI